MGLQTLHYFRLPTIGFRSMIALLFASFFVVAEITVDSKRIFGDSNDAAQYYDITFNYKSFDDPAQYDAPVGVTGIDA